MQLDSFSARIADTCLQEHVGSVWQTTDSEHQIELFGFEAKGGGGDSSLTKGSGFFGVYGSLDFADFGAQEGSFPIDFYVGSKARREWGETRN
jgi:hypothetical protein